jgi:cell division protease FtsH
MAPSPGRQGPREPLIERKGRQLPLKSWLVLMAIVVVVNLVFGYFDSKQQLTIPYSDFVNQTKSDNVKSVRFQGNQLSGEFAHGVNGQTLFFTQIPLVGATGDTSIFSMLQDHHVQVTASQGALDSLGSALNVFSGLLLLIFLGAMIYQARTGARLALGVGQSKARVYTEERPKTTFADVASNEEAKADLQEIIEYLREPTRFQKLGARIPRGVLLLGPPGTGKTLLARAVAGEAKVPFFSLSATEFVEMFVGVGAARVRDLFERAKKAAPCIVFVDEIDSIGRQRSGAFSIGGNDEREQTLNQLLVEMDGFEPNESVIVLSATNRPDILDPALLRPGRFDRRVEVGLPDRDGRLAILRLHAGKVAMDDGCDLESIARRTAGLAGADLANLINEAALAAARAKRDKVTQADLDEAFDRVILGARRRLALSDDDRRRVAVHEGGHALVAFLTPGADPLEKVTIVPHGRALGVTQFTNDDRLNLPESYVRARLAVALGGRAAERVVLNEISSGAENDLEAATAYAHRMVEKWGMGKDLGPVSVERDGYAAAAPGAVSSSPELATIADREVRRILHEADAQADHLLRRHQDELGRLADLLVERETIDRAEVEALVGLRES